MSLIINPSPADFAPQAEKEIASGNTGTPISTETVLQQTEAVNVLFKRKGWYETIKKSKLYARGTAEK